MIGMKDMLNKDKKDRKDRVSEMDETYLSAGDEKLMEQKKDVLNRKTMVIGVGGCGVNAIRRLGKAGVLGIGRVCISHDKEQLLDVEAEKKILIGNNICKGRGVGVDANPGEPAVKESLDEISEVLCEAQMVIVVCEWGDSAETGNAPVIADIARNMGILTLGVAAIPIRFESEELRGKAEDWRKAFTASTDSMIMVSNENATLGVQDKNSMNAAIGKLDSVLKGIVRGIVGTIENPGELCLCWDDFEGILKAAGEMYIGNGRAGGIGRCVVAVEQVLNDMSVNGKAGDIKDAIVIFNGDTEMEGVGKAAHRLVKMLNEDASICIGVSGLEPEEEGTVEVTVIASCREVDFSAKI